MGILTNELKMRFDDYLDYREAKKQYKNNKTTEEPKRTDYYHKSWKPFVLFLKNIKKKLPNLTTFDFLGCSLTKYNKWIRALRYIEYKSFK